jgi:regulator of RNase E activity RraB
MIGEHEHQIVGSWILQDGQLTPDANCARIEHLITAYLKRIGASGDGWAIYFVDPSGCRWELFYPQSHLHGGGPPTLQRSERSE